MARKPNHAYEKRQRELAKAAKRAAKLERKRERAAENATEAGVGEQTEDAPVTDGE